MLTNPSAARSRLHSELASIAPENEKLKQLREHGWLLLPGLLDREDLQAMHESWNASKNTRNQNWDLADSAAFTCCTQDPVMLGYIHSMIGPEAALTSLRGREPSEGNGQQGLHVDTVGPVAREDQHLMNGFWLLDNMDESNGGTRVVPGTHLNYHLPTGTYAQPHGSHPDEIVIAASAGDLLLFSAHLWHSGTKNVSGRRRRVVIAQFDSHSKGQWQQPSGSRS